MASQLLECVKAAISFESLKNVVHFQRVSELEDVLGDLTIGFCRVGRNDRGAIANFRHAFKQAVLLYGKCEILLDEGRLYVYDFFEALEVVQLEHDSLLPLLPAYILTLQEVVSDKGRDLCIVHL